MNILYVVHQFLPEYSTGTEILTYKTARCMRDRGHHVAVFTGFPGNGRYEDGNRFDHYEYDRIHVWRFMHSRTAMASQNNIAEAEYNNFLVTDIFSSLLDKVRPDLVHIFHFQRLSIAVVDVCQKFGVPMVYTPTDFWFECPTTQLLLPDMCICPGPGERNIHCFKHLAEFYFKSPQQKKIIRALPDWLFSSIITLSDFPVADSWKPLKMVQALAARNDFIEERLNALDRIVVPSKIIRSRIEHHIEDNHKLVDISFGIDAPPIVVKDKSDVLRIGFIGTIGEHKGAHILTGAMLSLPETMKIEARIYGDLNVFPEYSCRLNKHAAIDKRIKFCGTFRPDDINKVFSTIDVLVIPSLWPENTALVAYYAQSYTCPIISSRIDGMTDIIKHEVNGLMFDRGNIEDLSMFLKKVHDDRGFLRYLASNAIKPMNMKEYATKIERIYCDIIKGDRL